MGLIFTEKQTDHAIKSNIYKLIRNVLPDLKL